MKRLKREDLAQIPLGEEWDKHQLKLHYKQIYGGVAWPGKNPGYVVVLGMGYEKHFDNYDLYLLDELESSDTRELVRQCGVLDFRYKPQKWIGDRRDDAADRFIHEMNDEFSKEISEDFLLLSGKRLFQLAPTHILEMKQPFAYLFPQLKKLLDKDHRQLFLKNSKIISYFATIEPSHIPDITFGDFPAVEALAFAVIEMRRFGGQSNSRIPKEMDIAQSYTVESVL